MRKSVLVIALLAACGSVPAMAKDAKSAVESPRAENKASMSGPARLSDAEMDKVTAGVGAVGAGVRAVHACLGAGGDHGRIPFCVQ